jgi:ABC-2 type transport system permease protein
MKKILDIRKHWFLIEQLVIRDIKLKYRRSLLGVLWSVLNPLFMMIIISIIFSSLFNRSIEKFPLYYMGGTLIWGFFTEATNSSLTVLTANKKLITKINVPKIVFPLAKAVSSFVNVLFVFIAFNIVLLSFGVLPSLTFILVPVILTFVFCFVLGISLILSSLYVFLRDLKHIYGIINTAWMYLTPLFYPASIVPEQFRPIYNLNPMYRFVDYFRSVIVYHRWPTMWENLICALYGIGVLIIGILVFKKLEKKIVLYI